MTPAIPPPCGNCGWVHHRSDVRYCCGCGMYLGNDNPDELPDLDNPVKPA